MGIVASRAMLARETGVCPGGTRARGSGLLDMSAVLRTDGGSTPEYSRRKTGVRPATAISAASEMDPTGRRISILPVLGRVLEERAIFEPGLLTETHRTNSQPLSPVGKIQRV